MTSNDRFLSEYVPESWTHGPYDEQNIRKGWQTWRLARREWFSQHNLDVDVSMARFKEQSELKEALASRGYTYIDKGGGDEILEVADD